MERRYLIAICAVIDHALTILLRHMRIMPDRSHCREF